MVEGGRVPAAHGNNTHNAVIVDHFRNARTLTGFWCMHMHVQRVDKGTRFDCMHDVLGLVQEACRASLPRMKGHARALHSVT